MSDPHEFSHVQFMLDPQETRGVCACGWLSAPSVIPDGSLAMDLWAEHAVLEAQAEARRNPVESQYRNRFLGRWDTLDEAKAAVRAELLDGNGNESGFTIDRSTMVLSDGTPAGWEPLLQMRRGLPGHEEPEIVEIMHSADYDGRADG